MINFLESYWPMILLIAIGLGVIIFAISTSKIKITEQQMNNLKEWLLYAVAAAEKEFGSKTGELKLRYVYNEFIKKFPDLSNVISFEYFNHLVDQTLAAFKILMESNSSIKEYISRKEK